MGAVGLPRKSRNWKTANATRSDGLTASDRLLLNKCAARIDSLEGLSALMSDARHDNSHIAKKGLFGQRCDQKRSDMVPQLIVGSINPFGLKTLYILDDTAIVSSWGGGHHPKSG